MAAYTATIQQQVEMLRRLQHTSGLFSAAPSRKTGYHRAWIRDNIYTAMGLEKHDTAAAIRAYRALLDIFLKHEYKIDWAIKEKPDAPYKYIHARYDPDTLNEIPEEWGNKQNDAIGAFLFVVGTLEKQGVPVLRDVNDYRIVQKLVFYLGRIEYWHDRDNGMWEEQEEVHASSIGACLAGLQAVSNLLYVPEQLIENGRQAIDRLLPRESAAKEADLALLSLIFPYNIATPAQRSAILRNVEEKLVRKNGVLRYIGDRYYSNGKEAEWTFGFPWLAIIHRQLGNLEKYAHYMGLADGAVTGSGELPELYYANTGIHNENTPLAWAHALYLMAAEEAIAAKG